MKATDLSRNIWNGIADLVSRNVAAREIYFVKVKKVDKTRSLIWVNDFGDIGIPLVAHSMGFAYYDTIATGEVQRREDPTFQNDNFRTKIITPDVGDMVVILDPWGAKRFPICIGTLQSKAGFWEGA